MARRYAITAVGNAILDLLRDALPKEEFGTLPFPLYQTADLQKGLTGEGVGLYLYRIGVNGTRRNQPPRRQRLERAGVFRSRRRQYRFADWRVLDRFYSLVYERERR